MFEGKKLGFGLMRLPLTDANDKESIDIEALKEMVDTFMERGFTYFDTAYIETYCDMIPSGIVDPTKVTRTALENAASIASCVLTTESLVADKPDPKAAAAMAAAAQGGGMGGMY